MSELRPKSLDAILNWWAQELGISGADLQSTQPGITLTGNPLIPGVLAFQRGGFVRIAATPGKLDRIHDAVVGKKVAQIFTPEFWRKHVRELSGKVIGPAVLYYSDKAPESWKKKALPPGVTIRGLAAMDGPAFGDFLSTLPAEEKETSGLEFGPQPTWGAFADGRLVGVAGFDSWPEKIAHVNVGVRPSFRRKGIGGAVVRAAAKGALARKRIVQYRTLAASTGSVALAKSLGWELFAETIYVRPAGSL